MLLETGRKGNPWHVVAECLVTLSHAVTWNVENVSNGL